MSWANAERMSNPKTSIDAKVLLQPERKARLSLWLRSASLRHGAALGIAMMLAGGMDYAVNVVAGRWLEPVQYGVFISVTAILQIWLLLTLTIRIVIAFYTVELKTQENAEARVGSFLRQCWLWAGKWGLVATGLMALCSPLLARQLHLPNSWPLLAGSLMVLMLFLREATYGVLQGGQAFAGLGVVQVAMAGLRLLLSAALIWLGGQAVGAILGQPLSCALGLTLALWWLRPYLFAGNGSAASYRRVSWHYSVHTFLGLTIFGVLTNLDAVFVKRFFSPQVAGNYGPVVTLAKMSLFLPWALGIILFPKVAQRQATGRDPRPILFFSIIAALAPGGVLTVIYFVAPRILVTAIFTGAYSDPGVVLGLVSLAATLYSGLNIWLNYSLSLNRAAFVYALGAVLAWQLVGMFLFGRHSLVTMAVIMVSAGIIGNLAGLLTTWSSKPVSKPSLEAIGFAD